MQDNSDEDGDDEDVMIASRQGFDWSTKAMYYLFQPITPEEMLRE